MNCRHKASSEVVKIHFLRLIIKIMKVAEQKIVLTYSPQPVILIIGTTLHITSYINLTFG